MSSASANALGGGATGRRRAPRASIALTLLLCAIDIDPVLALDLAGLPLTQALQVLEERGLMLLYSSDLVQPWMRVQEDPDVEDPRRALESIVQPFVITVVDGPNGSLMLVRARPSTPPGEVAEEPSKDDPVDTHRFSLSNWWVSNAFASVSEGDDRTWKQQRRY